MKRILILLPIIALGGCETFDSIVTGLKKSRGPESVPFSERPQLEPIDSNTFFLTSEDQTVVGEPQIVLTNVNDTFSDLARTYGLGYDELVAANPDIDPWLPGEGRAVLLPTQYVLPDVPKQGVVLNIATKRLFYYPAAMDGEPPKVLTYPIGIGRVGWETPLGETTVVAKAKNPSWWVPASVRKEHAEMGDPLPSVVPPGPENPLGTRVLKLNMPGYLIHGTNQPYGVGMRVSHGCVRLYPENIEFLYTLVNIGESVTILNEPYQLGARDGLLYFEAHEPLEDDAIAAEDRLQQVVDAALDSQGNGLNDHLREHIVTLSQLPTGVPTSIVQYDANEVLERVRVVRNTVIRDPNEPTLSEVRELMIEADTE